MVEWSTPRSLVWRKKNGRVLGERCVEGVDSAGFPAGGVWCEVNLPNLRGYHIP